MKRSFPLVSLFLLALAAPAPAAPTASAADGKLVILGFDGADGDVVREMMEGGELPNLKRLAEQGTFAPLTTTAPAESPASWASLNTGQNPGKTAVPSFVRRDLGAIPVPNMGHIKLDQTRTLDELHATPIPTWDRATFAGICGGAAFLAFLIVLSLLLRIKGAVAVVLSLLLGGGGAYGGWVLRGYLPDEYETIANRLQATPFWETAAEHGVPSVVLAAAQTFDRAPVDGAKVLAGLGVPDALGGVQNFSFYTTDDLFFSRPPEGKSTGSGGTKYRVDERDGLIESILVGPKNLWKIDQVKKRLAELEEALADPTLGYKDSLVLQDEEAELEDRLEILDKEPEGRLTQPLRVELGAESALVTLGQESQELAEGEWSGWYHLTFGFNPLVKVEAITRAKILSMEDPFTLYVDSIQIDPAAPPFWQPISQPNSFAAELAAQNGPYETIGWACATMPFKDEELDPVSFMEEIEFTFRTREEMTLAALERDDWRIFMSTLSTPDRVQHMMYQFFDPENPMHDPEAAQQEMTFFGETITLADAIPAIYRQIDRIVGVVLENHVGPNDVLMLCADHGFQSFHDQVHINNWLAEEGFLTLKDPLPKPSRLPFWYVDWSKTQAYSLGLGMIYLNRVGDPTGGGVVKPEEELDVLNAISDRFLAATDPATGASIGRETYVLSEVHSGPFVTEEADMMLGFDVGYRVSWATSGGALSTEKNDDGEVVLGPMIEPNDKTWSGDHTSTALDLVAGMFFCSEKVQVPEDGVNLLHVAPTALSIVGVPIPSEYDLEPLQRVSN